MLYHYLLVGLQDLALDTKQKLTAEQLEEEIRKNLSKHDCRAFDLLCMRPDDVQVTAILDKTEYLGEEDALDDKSTSWRNLCEVDKRAQIVYEQGMKSKNAFVRDWFAFNLNLNNILAATICRKHSFDISKAIVGEGEIQDALRTSKAKDFGLVADFPEVADMLRLAEVENLYEREKKTDALRWAWLEERTKFHYYEAENVYAYWLQAKMLFRWDMLNVEEGQQVFRALIADMKRDVKFS